MEDCILDKVVKNPFKQGICVDLKPLRVRLDPDFFDINMRTGRKEGFMDVLPCRCHDAEVLVQPGEFDILANDGDRVLHLPDVHGVLGFRRTLLDEVEISPHHRELVPDIVAGDLGKQVEFLVCQLECILRHLDIRDIVEDLKHAAPSAEIDDGRARNNRDMPLIAVRDNLCLEGGSLLGVMEEDCGKQVFFIRRVKVRLVHCFDLLGRPADQFPGFPVRINEDAGFSVSNENCIIGMVHETAVLLIFRPEALIANRLLTAFFIL